jgi:hypothetical protein
MVGRSLCQLYPVCEVRGVKQREEERKREEEV